MPPGIESRRCVRHMGCCGQRRRWPLRRLGSSYVDRRPRVDSILVAALAGGFVLAVDAQSAAQSFEDGHALRSRRSSWSSTRSPSDRSASSSLMPFGVVGSSPLPDDAQGPLFSLDVTEYANAAAAMPATPQLAFPQQLNPNLNASHWRPRFIDYLYLGLTNSPAFSPTDVMPLAPWAKIVMGVQSVVSLVILGLVVARAVNVLA